MELDNGIEKSQIIVDPAKPFAIALPENLESVTFYDANENTIEIRRF